MLRRSAAVRQSSWSSVLKTVVGKATGKAGGNDSLVASAGSGGGAKTGAAGALASIKTQMEAMFEEKEWTCHCGHKFKAAGEWYPTEPASCEAPGCPNPSYYIDGPGRAMLEAGGCGGGNAKVGGADAGQKKLPDKTGMGGRFK